MEHSTETLGIIDRTIRYAEKRTEIRNQSMWRITRAEDSKYNSYQQGYIDAMNQVLGFMNLIRTPKPERSDLN